MQVSVQFFAGVVTNLTTTEFTIGVEMADLKFSCPSRGSLEFPEHFENCKEPRSRTSFVPLYPPMSPGPSEQTHAFREIILAALETKSDVSISPFTIHIRDKLSHGSNVPVGLRIDLHKLCKIVGFNKKPSKIDKIGFVSKNEKNERKEISYFLNSYLGFHKVHTETMMKNPENFEIKSAIFRNFPKSSDSNFTHLLETVKVFPKTENFSSEELELKKKYSHYYGPKIIGIAKGIGIIQVGY